MFKALILSALLLVSGSTFAATAAIDTSGLTDTQKAELALKAAQMKDEASGVTVDSVTGALQNLSKFEGIGKETGVAVREGLTAVVDVADQFGKTNVGQITIALIVWRVAGADIMQLVLGFIALIVGIYMFNRLTRDKMEVRTWITVRRMFGMYEKRIPDEFTMAKQTEEMRTIGVIALGVGVAIMVVALANIG